MGRLDEFEGRWQQETQAIVRGVKEWRLQHPRATFREIEAALDERLDRMRARLLEDLALASAAVDPRQQPAGERARCPSCGEAVQARGRRERMVVTQGEQPVRLERSYVVCPSCGDGFFPPG